MRSLLALLAVSLLSTLVNGILVITPSNTTTWTAGQHTQMISWQAVPTDQTSFVIQLINQDGFIPFSSGSVILATNQITGNPNEVNSATVTYASDWPTGNNFQLNFMASDQSNAAILAQSAKFNITSGGPNNAVAQVSKTSTFSSKSTPTTTGLVTNQTLTNGAAVKQAASSTSTSQMSASSSASSSAAASTSGAAVLRIGNPAFLSVLITAASLFGIAF